MVNGLEQAALVALANLNNGGKVGQPNPNPNPNPGLKRHCSVYYR